MFSRRSHGDVRKSAQKALDPRRDVLTRLKHLRALLDNVDASDLKQFFETNYSQIYFIFYENFITLENSLKLKGNNKSQREELDSILFLFEKILQFLPERIFFRWHYQSIGSTLKKLLHTGNSIKIRCEGIRLFLLWLQALQTNCAEEQVLMFACLVPGFPAVLSSRGPCTLETLINPGPAVADAKIYPEEITPLLPAGSGEKIAEDQTCFFLQILLKCMVIQAASLEWKNKENQDTGFKFLFTLFRKYYLPHLFPSFTKLTNIYKPVLDIPRLRPKPVYITITRDNENIYSTKIPYMAARVIFIKWIVTFFLEKKYLTTTQNTKNGVDVLPKIIQTVGGSAVQDRVSEPDGGGPAEQDRHVSSSGALSEHRLSASGLCSVEEEHRVVYEMVQGILLSTRGYVNFVNEVFRQAFLLPSCEIAVTRNVVQVYRKWLLQDKPVFMEEPEAKDVAQEDAGKLGFSETDSKEASSEGSGHKRSSSWGRTYSFTSAMSRGCVAEEDNTNVKAGAQATLQVFLTNAANVFLLESCSEVPALLREHVDACKAVLIIFRRIIMELTMDAKTWEQMLQILLRITEAVLQKPKDKQIKDLFAQSLAGLLFRTLIVAWVRASLCVPISRELWDGLLAVLSSLTEWEELIVEWANIMDSLTAVLARTVYGVEMTKLPLDKLSEQKEKKQRGRGCVLDPQKGTSVGRSFSLSWRNHPDVTEPMRFRSATTSGTPGVEKARNTVRQKAAAKRSQSASSCVRLPEAPLLLQAASARFPGLSRSSSRWLSGVEECPKAEGVPRSSSTSDLCEPHASQGQTAETAPGLSSSDPKPPAENQGPVTVTGEREGKPILERRSSSPAELDLKEDPPRLRERQKSESSEAGLSCHGEAELPGGPGQTCEPDPDPELSTPADAHHWLQLSPTDASNLTDSSECLADDCSVIAGGKLSGWHPDSAAVLWRRVLGILGDVNAIQSPKIHAKVFCYLYELWYKLAKIRDNLAVSLDNQSSPSPPVLIPPLRMFASWLFKATTLPSEYKEGKLQAYRLICAMMTRRQDVLPNEDFLVHFYLVMHLGLTSEDQDVLNTIIGHCPPRFFSLGLPGSTMLVGDFITAAARVLSSDTLAAPRSEALTILGSLVCFPNTYPELPVLRSVPEAHSVVTGTEDVKHYLINILLKNATEEPNECARCIAICSLGVWICEELARCTGHPQVKEAINVIGVTLKFPNKVVAQVACDILHLLVSYWEKLQMFETSLPRKMTEILVATIAFLLPSAEYSSVETDKKLIVSLLLCLLDWCMALPVKALLLPVSTMVLEDQHPAPAPLLDYIYRVLHCCVCGPSADTQGHSLLSLADLSSADYDPFLPLADVRASEAVPCQAAAELGSLLTVEQERRRRSAALIPLTARVAMAHLVNHLGHFPQAGGPALLHSLLGEGAVAGEGEGAGEGAGLSEEALRSPGLQVFGLRDGTLLSVLQTRAHGRPGVRVIVRDLSGKYAWDSRLLHGPPAPRPAKPPSPPPDADADVDAGPPAGCGGPDPEDALDSLLRRLARSSPECLAPGPPGPPDPEPAAAQALLRQAAREAEHARCPGPGAQAARQARPAPAEPRAPFYLCRLLLDGLGMNSWGRRKNFHILKKNPKLLRELKNLDSRQCRETHKIAVFYIAEGQEDKCSILSNERGSQAYEDFVAGLGWEVDLATHCGFMGGLQRNGSTGQTAPYYATSTVEVIFHVSTRMPSGSDDSLTKKLRHLGNDEVHIIWSEHSRDYRRGIIPTAFGDVSIIIYPMKNQMFFIAIRKKPEVPFFGPLFDGAIVSRQLLPSLVCATGVNASRAVKCLLPLYQTFYEERAVYLEAIIQNHREVMTFEDFAAQVFSPSPGYSLGGTD